MAADGDARAAIETLKYRYLRHLDLKQWDEFGDTLTADVQASYGDRLAFSERDAVLAYFREALGPAVITVHHCHHPELEVRDDTARGTWYLQDTVIVTDHRLMITGAAFYDDEYRRESDGRWRIARTGYRRSYEAVQPLPDGWRLTANAFAAPASDG